MNAEDILKYGHLTVMGVIDGLPEANWETPGVCGVWSVRQIIAHLASYERLLVDIFSSLLDGGPTLVLDHYLADYDGFNDAEVAARETLAAAGTLDEYVATCEQNQQLLARLPVIRRRQNGILAWYGAEYDLEDFLVYSFYGHKREHAAQIAVFRDLLATGGG